MTDLPIVAVVKELRESTDHCDVVEKKILELFPAVADALEIAVEALEEIEIGSIKNGKWTMMDKTTNKEVVTEALDRIRSLLLR